MSNAHDYNAKLIQSGVLTAEHITEMVRVYQAHKALPADGKCGPLTRDHLKRDLRPADAETTTYHTFTLDDTLVVDAFGWLQGPGVLRLPMHATWYSGHMKLGPRAIVAHYTATNPGTAQSMARNRMDSFDRDPSDGHVDRSASWHLSIESALTNHPIVQMAPLTAVCWHAGGKGSKPIPGIGSANSNAVGIELVGWGKAFPDQQVVNACRVWRAIVKHYRIAEAHAMVQHSHISPHDRSDPGPVWMGTHAGEVLKYSYSL